MEMQAESVLKIGPFPSLEVTISTSTRYFNAQSSSYEEDKDKILVWDEKGRNKIAQIFISHDDEYIKSLAFQYVEEDGKLKLSPVYGCKDLHGFTFETVTFKEACDNEYITRVSGAHYLHGLKSLTIETNVATYGPFGIVDKYNNHNKFQIGLGHGDQFGGFHGTSCTSRKFITSIGVYLKPIQDLNVLSKNNHDQLSQLSIH